MITMQKYEILLYHANILVLFLRFFLEWICKVLDISEYAIPLVRLLFLFAG